MVRIVQISDCHIVEEGELVADRADSAAGLRAALDEIAPLRPALIVATGDLVNDGRPAQYDRLESLLAAAPAPVVAVPGNHDDRTELRRRFADLPAGGADDPIDHVVEVDTGDAEQPLLRLVLLDTQVPGRVGGAIRPEQAAWLDERLAEAPGVPTIVFQHHPPFASGIAFMDTEPLEGAELQARVIARHPHVALVACGHLHRPIHRIVGGAIGAVCASTAVTIGLAVDADEPEYTSEAPGFAVHDWDRDSGLRTYWHATGPIERWVPSWARCARDV